MRDAGATYQADTQVDGLLSTKDVARIAFDALSLLLSGRRLKPELHEAKQSGNECVTHLLRVFSLLLLLRASHGERATQRATA